MNLRSPRRPEVPAAASSVRFERLDALRALAMLWMAVFHCVFDLNQARLLVPAQDFYRDPLWTVQRSCIVGLFLFCAGAGQALALQQGQGWARFWRRWAQVVVCALLVSAGSAWMFPRSFISFGVLHGIAVMLPLARWAAPLGTWLWPLGALALALPWFVQNTLFDSRWTNWVGLVTRKPVTEDFVPVLPWLGMVLWGLAAMQWLLRHRPDAVSGRAGAGGDLTRRLAALGRWPLSFYMLHQPVLLAVILGWQALMR